MRTASSKREVLAVAHPVSEQVRLDRRVRHLAHVRAGVGEAHHGVAGAAGSAASGRGRTARTSARRTGAGRSRARAGSSARPDARRAPRRASATVGFGGTGDVEHLHAVELGRARLAAERRAVGALVGDLHQPGDDVGVVRGAAAARRAGSARSSRHSGRRSNGSWVRNDENAPMPRGWVRPHMRAPAAAATSSSASAGVVHRRESTNGTPVVSARSRY